jgi:hypothetical protein
VFDEGALLAHLFAQVPELQGNESAAIELVKFWLGGSGLENMDGLAEMYCFNRYSLFITFFNRF